MDNSGDIERRLAYQANQSGYDTRDERTYIAGAPHIQHAQIRALLAELAEEALGEGLSVLDVGGGSGLASFAWLGRGLDVTVVDSSSEMLRYYAAREPAARPIVADIGDWLAAADDRFDLVTLVSTLHHIPNYLGALRACTGLVRQGGSLMTFQDPLYYPRLRRTDYWFARMAYYSWRITRGNFRQGARTLSRRLRGRLDPSEPADFEEYHVVRQGVDEVAVAAMLEPEFESVRVVKYWATQGRLQQRVGHELGLHGQFAVIARGRR